MIAYFLSAATQTHRPIYMSYLNEGRSNKIRSYIYSDTGVNTDVTGDDLKLLEAESLGLTEKVQLLEQECAELKEK